LCIIPVRVELVALPRSHHADVLYADCGIGMGDMYLTSDSIKADIARRTPHEADRGNVINFGCWTAEMFEDVIRADVDKLRGEKMLDGMHIVGMAFVTETGELKEVC
jgi:hypothetical protein